MIYDLLVNIGNYRGMNRNLDKAIDYLMTVDINTLPLGKTEIDGDRVFLQVMEARTHELTDESYEVHRDYMDIQIDIDGCEVIETGIPAGFSEGGSLCRSRGTLRYGARQVYPVHGRGGSWAGRMPGKA